MGVVVVPFPGEYECVFSALKTLFRSWTNCEIFLHKLTYMMVIEINGEMSNTVACNVNAVAKIFPTFPAVKSMYLSAGAMMRYQTFCEALVEAYTGSVQFELLVDWEGQTGAELLIFGKDAAICDEVITRIQIFQSHHLPNNIRSFTLLKPSAESMKFMDEIVMYSGSMIVTKHHQGGSCSVVFACSGSKESSFKTYNWIVRLWNENGCTITFDITIPCLVREVLFCELQSIQTASGSKCAVVNDSDGVALVRVSGQVINVYRAVVHLQRIKAYQLRIINEKKMLVRLLPVQSNEFLQRFCSNHCGRFDEKLGVVVTHPKIAKFSLPSVEKMETVYVFASDERQWQKAKTALIQLDTYGFCPITHSVKTDYVELLGNGSHAQVLMAINEVKSPWTKLKVETFRTVATTVDETTKETNQRVKISSPNQRCLQLAKKKVEFVVFQHSIDYFPTECDATGISALEHGWGSEFFTTASRSRSMHNYNDCAILKPIAPNFQSIASYLDMKSLLQLHATCLTAHDLTGNMVTIVQLVPSQSQSMRFPVRVPIMAMFSEWMNLLQLGTPFRHVHYEQQGAMIAYPISSILLEDNLLVQKARLVGRFRANTDPSALVRLESICDAVREVIADPYSTVAFYKPVKELTVAGYLMGLYAAEQGEGGEDDESEGGGSEADEEELPPVDGEF